MVTRRPARPKPTARPPVAPPAPPLPIEEPLHESTRELLAAEAAHLAEVQRRVDVLLSPGQEWLRHKSRREQEDLVATGRRFRSGRQPGTQSALTRALKRLLREIIKTHPTSKPGAVWGEIRRRCLKKRDEDDDAPGFISIDDIGGREALIWSPGAGKEQRTSRKTVMNHISAIRKAHALRK